jgi:hypothetical protein
MRIAEKEPVREFVGDHRSLARNLLGTLQAARAAAVEELATIDCTTFEDYRLRKGKIEGIDIAISLCKEEQRKLEA